LEHLPVFKAHMDRLPGLTPKQSRVVEKYVALGSLSAACKAEGYGVQTAYRLLRENAAFQEACTLALRAHQLDDAIKARFVVRNLLENAKDAKVRMQAAREATERGLGKAPDRHLHLHHHKHEMDRDQLLDRISSLAQELGLNQDQLLAGRNLTLAPAGARTGGVPLTTRNRNEVARLRGRSEGYRPGESHDRAPMRGPPKPGAEGAIGLPDLKPDE